MITIDVAQRAASRERHPMISFRRTEADRRPARRVVMPNDGPAPDREAQEQAIREKLKAKAKPKAPPHVAPKIEAILWHLLDGPRDKRQLAEALGLKVTTIGDRSQSALAIGVMQSEHAPGGKVVYRLTDVGRAVLGAKSETR